MKILFAAFPTYDLLYPDLREAVIEVSSWEELRNIARTPFLEERAWFRDTGLPVGTLANFCIDRECPNECCFPARELI